MCQCEITRATPTPMHDEHHMETEERSLSPTGSQQLVLFYTINYYDNDNVILIVGWFCCFEGTVTAQLAVCVCRLLLCWTVNLFNL